MRTFTILTAAATTAALALGAPGHPTERVRTPHARSVTTIVVRVHSNRGPVPTHLLGVNHHYNANGYHLWDPATDAPAPGALTGARRAGLETMRFPGGTVANTYSWKRAIGPDHLCQVVGPHGGDPARALTSGLAFGPDEFMRFLDLTGARPIIMVPFVVGTPADAADWVEYMNAPAGSPGNPHGGVDWADVRATNGHPAPYHVHWWEIGNEQHHSHSRYWMSHHDAVALRQYAFGGSRFFSGENLGKGCAHPPAGIASDGTAGQTFGVLYPPVASRSFQVVIGGRSWTRISDLATAGPRARVFTLDARAGQVRFGNGVHGAIPPAGSAVRASYRTVHKGVFAFARRMKEVDPSIKVCPSWGTTAFPRLVGGRDYDCLTAHAIAVFSSPTGRKPHWSGPLEGHDAFMLKSESVPSRVRDLLHALPPRHPLLLTEFLALHGDSRAYPHWEASESQAVFMASLWARWLTMRIPWGNGDDFLWSGDRGMLGAAPDYTFSADAVTRQAVAPMFSVGGTLLSTLLSGNPVRRPSGTRGSYPGLVVAATRHAGVVRLLVVNRLPLQRLRVRIRLDGARSTRRAGVRSVTGTSFAASNLRGQPPSVVLHRRGIAIGATGFTHVFPAASTTVIRIALR